MWKRNKKHRVHCYHCSIFPSSFRCISKIVPVWIFFFPRTQKYIFMFTAVFIKKILSMLVMWEVNKYNCRMFQRAFLWKRLHSNKTYLRVETILLKRQLPATSALLKRPKFKTTLWMWLFGAWKEEKKKRTPADPAIPHPRPAISQWVPNKTCSSSFVLPDWLRVLTEDLLKLYEGHVELCFLFSSCLALFFFPPSLASIL